MSILYVNIECVIATIRVFIKGSWEYFNVNYYVPRLNFLIKFVMAVYDCGNFFFS